MSFVAKEEFHKDGDAEYKTIHLSKMLKYQDPTALDLAAKVENKRKGKGSADMIYVYDQWTKEGAHTPEEMEAYMLGGLAWCVAWFRHPDQIRYPDPIHHKDEPRVKNQRRRASSQLL